MVFWNLKHKMLGRAVFRLTLSLLSLFMLSANEIVAKTNEKLQFEQITSIQGLSNNTVYDITQDNDGYIWIATREGLNKFDGQVITTYYQKDYPGIPGNFIEQVLVTSGGKLLVGTQKGVCVYNKESDNFSQLLYQGASMGDLYRILELSSGELLISTNLGLFLINEGFEVQEVSDQSFYDLCEYQTGIVWGLYNDEIVIMNTEGEVIRRYSDDSGTFEGFDLSSSNVERLYKDSRGVLWLCTKRNGIGYYDQESDCFYCLKLQQGVNPIEDNFVRIINEDYLGRLWIGTESGLYIYDVEKENFTFYGQNFIPYDKGLNDKAIYSIFRSRDNLMWIGTYFGGVNYTNLLQRGFYRIYADGGKERLSGNAISEIIETSSGKLWIGTEDGGINIFDQQKGTFEYLRHNPGDPRSLSSNNVHALEEDEQGNIWIGTFLGGLNKYNSRTKKIEPVPLIPPEEDMKQDVYSKSLFSILIDSKKRVWVGSLEGLYLREKPDGEFRIWSPEYFLNNFVYNISEDQAGDLWVCTYNRGIFRIDSEMNITSYQVGGKYDIRSNRIVSCLVASEKEIWFGTVEGGLILYNTENDSFKSYTETDGLPDNTVYAIVQDRDGNIWVSTNRGISMFDPESGVFTNYTENDGLIGNQFNFKSGLMTSEGIIYFGAVNGLTYFDPRKLRKDTIVPDLHFTDLKIFNNPVKVGKDNILKYPIDYQGEIDLKHQHKVFTIDFVGINYIAPRKTVYAYYLEGLEERWNYVGNKQSATYTNLSPGKYIFHLKATNSDNMTASAERRLIINVSPPFWSSLWGFIIYAVLLLSVTFFIIRFSMMRQKEKMKIRLANMEKEKNEEISRHRLNFFTYISHEFKTPLTLIIATLDHIMNYEDILPKFKDYGIVMRKNAMRLLFLINQLMEFRKIETDHAAIKFNRGEIIGFIRSTFMTFKPLMQNKSVKWNFTSNEESYIVYFDADKLEKILTNLISNSCKSFKEPGTINVDVRIAERNHLADPSGMNEKNGSITITIVDDGPGLPPEKLNQVFEPFRVSDTSDSLSSGIGLSLVKGLVKQLGGQIMITSPQKGGTSVIVQLPLVHNPAPELIKDETFIDSNITSSFDGSILYLDQENEEYVEISDDGSSREYDLLVVEDNKELAAFLAHHFNMVFRVHLAYDGEEGLQKVKKCNPDLIISDIMMPKMDGFTLCSQVKESIETSHIPVILLTSKNSEESRMEGYYKGADAYVGKPFKLKELDLQIRNILRARENIRKHFASFEGIRKSVSKLGNKDQMFIRMLTDTVHKHLDDGSFDVEQFCQEANVSRTLLHMKIKKITGLSTTEFIKNIRLSEAKKMLEEGRYTISEIAYRVGYNDPAYFSKSFKKLFGKSPSEFEHGSSSNPV